MENYALQTLLDRFTIKGRGEVEMMETKEEIQQKKQLLKDIAVMAWPAVCESFFVSLVGMIDVYMVSGLGADTVAAIGLTTQPKFVGLAFFFAMSVAISALVARRRGQKDQKAANKILVTALVISVIAAILISTVAIAFADQILTFCGSTTQTHDSAVIYFRIIMGGVILNALTLVINAAQRGSGNTKIAMKTNLVSNLVNVVGNYLIIEGNLGFPALGIRGAAIATVFGTLIGCIMSVRSLLKKDIFVSIPYILKERIRPAAESLRNIVKVGYSVFLEQILLRVGFMATAMMAADMGTNPMAAHQVGMNILGLSFSFGEGMQVTAVALIGKSLGENNQEKAKAYGKLSRRIGLGISICLAVIYFLCGEWIYSLFFKEAEIVAIGVDMIRLIIVIVLFQVSQVIYMGCLRGAGDTAYTAFVSTICVTVIRTAASWLFAYPLGLGMNGVWLGILADQVARYILVSIRFKQGKWVNIKI